jgi:hypothetical protein
MKTKFEKIRKKAKDISGSSISPNEFGYCYDCHLDVRKADSCVKSQLNIGGRNYTRNTHNTPEQNDPDTDRCHDCGIKLKGIHHIGCDVEICPVCDFQLITCICNHNWHVWDSESFQRGLPKVEQEIFRQSNDGKLKRTLAFQIIHRRSAEKGKTKHD